MVRKDPPPALRLNGIVVSGGRPADGQAGVHVADVLARFPELLASPQVDAWLAGIERRWVGRVTTRRHDGGGWFVLRTPARRPTRCWRVPCATAAWCSPR